MTRSVGKSLTFSGFLLMAQGLACGEAHPVPVAVHGEPETARAIPFQEAQARIYPGERQPPRKIDHPWTGRGGSSSIRHPPRKDNK